MLYVLMMSTDREVTATRLGEGWEEPVGCFSKEEVAAGDLHLQDGSDIVVVAHDDDMKAGKAASTSDILPAHLHELIARNLGTASPRRIYLSPCHGPASGFTARFRDYLDYKDVWQGTELYALTRPVEDEVPAPGSGAWFRMYLRRRNRRCSCTLAA